MNNSLLPLFIIQKFPQLRSVLARTKHNLIKFSQECSKPECSSTFGLQPKRVLRHWWLSICLLCIYRICTTQAAYFRTKQHCFCIVLQPQDQSTVGTTLPAEMAKNSLGMRRQMRYQMERWVPRDRLARCDEKMMSQRSANWRPSSMDPEHANRSFFGLCIPTVIVCHWTSSQNHASIDSWQSCLHAIMLLCIWQCRERSRPPLKLDNLLCSKSFPLRTELHAHFCIML